MRTLSHRFCDGSVFFSGDYFIVKLYRNGESRLIEEKLRMVNMNVSAIPSTVTNSLTIFRCIMFNSFTCDQFCFIIIIYIEQLVRPFGCS